MPTFEEKYRRKVPEGVISEASPAMETLKEAAKDEYKAFYSVSESQFDLWIRPNAANEDTDTSIPYSRRNSMISDGSGFMIYMQFDGPILSVRLHGRNLQDLHRKLLKHEVEWVMEFDPRKWEALPDNAACITGIHIKRKPLHDSDETRSAEKEQPAKPATH